VTGAEADADGRRRGCTDREIYAGAGGRRGGAQRGRDDARTLGKGTAKIRALALVVVLPPHVSVTSSAARPGRAVGASGQRGNGGGGGVLPAADASRR
jgi:hypothetical protein